MTSNRRLAAHAMRACIEFAMDRTFRFYTKCTEEREYTINVVWAISLKLVRPRPFADKFSHHAQDARARPHKSCAHTKCLAAPLQSYVTFAQRRTAPPLTMRNERARALRTLDGHTKKKGFIPHGHLRVIDPRRSFGRNAQCTITFNITMNTNEGQHISWSRMYKFEPARDGAVAG